MYLNCMPHIHYILHLISLHHHIIIFACAVPANISRQPRHVTIRTLQRKVPIECIFTCFHTHILLITKPAPTHDDAGLIRTCSNDLITHVLLGAAGKRVLVLPASATIVGLTRTVVRRVGVQNLEHLELRRAHSHGLLEHEPGHHLRKRWCGEGPIVVEVRPRQHVFEGGIRVHRASNFLGESNSGEFPCPHACVETQ